MLVYGNPIKCRNVIDFTWIFCRGQYRTRRNQLQKEKLNEVELSKNVIELNRFEDIKKTKRLLIFCGKILFCCKSIGIDSNLADSGEEYCCVSLLFNTAVMAVSFGSIFCLFIFAIDIDDRRKLWKSINLSHQFVVLM